MTDEADALLRDLFDTTARWATLPTRPPALFALVGAETDPRAFVLGDMVQGRTPQPGDATQRTDAPAPERPLLLADVHALWCSEPVRSRHPLAPIVDSWQELAPSAVALDVRLRAILPAPWRDLNRDHGRLPLDLDRCALGAGTAGPGVPVLALQPATTTPYLQSIKARIADRLGGMWSPLRRDAVRESPGVRHRARHRRFRGADSGLCAVSACRAPSLRVRPGQLDARHAGANRYQKRGHDAAEWLPARNRCWFAAAIVAVRREYDLTIDRREAAALEAVLPGGQHCFLRSVRLDGPAVCNWCGVEADPVLDLGGPPPVRCRRREPAADEPSGDLFGGIEA